MKINKKLSKILHAAKSGEFCKFTYTKENKEKSVRIVRFGGDISKRLDKQGTPVNGKGSWTTGNGHYKNGVVVIKDKKVYVRGTDVSPGSKPAHKVFILDGISFE